MSDDADRPAPPPGKPERTPERDSRAEMRSEPREPRERAGTEPPVRPVPDGPSGREHPEGDRLTETIRQRLETLVPDLVKKTFAAGMGAVFTTEEGIRRVIGGARENLPEVAGYIASSADGAKDKVFEIIARETREFLSNLNLTEEVAKLLTTLSFEIKTEIRFIPNSERMVGAEPDVKASVRLKRNEAQVGADKRDKDEESQNRDSRSRLKFWRRDDGAAEGDEDDNHEK